MKILYDKENGKFFVAVNNEIHFITLGEIRKLVKRLGTSILSKSAHSALYKVFLRKRKTHLISKLKTKKRIRKAIKKVKQKLESKEKETTPYEPKLPNKGYSTVENPSFQAPPSIFNVPQNQELYGFPIRVQPTTKEPEKEKVVEKEKKKLEPFTYGTELNGKLYIRCPLCEKRFLFNTYIVYSLISKHLNSVHKMSEEDRKRYNKALHDLVDMEGLEYNSETPQSSPVVSSRFKTSVSSRLLEALGVEEGVGTSHIPGFLAPEVASRSTVSQEMAEVAEAQTPMKRQRGRPRVHPLPEEASTEKRKIVRPGKSTEKVESPRSQEYVPTKSVVEPTPIKGSKPASRTWSKQTVLPFKP